ncbi:EF-hand domain-containing protein [Verrucomicrobiaceae bacterium 227]
MDADNDGKVTFTEMQAFAKNRRGGELNEDRFKARFEAMDTNGNGSLSSEELANAPRGGARTNR